MGIAHGLLIDNFQLVFDIPNATRLTRVGRSLMITHHDLTPVLHGKQLGIPS